MNLPRFPFFSLPNLYTNEVAKGVNKAQKNPSSCNFISSFIVSITLAINTHKSSNDFMILIRSFTFFYFEINKLNPVPALTALSPLISHSNFFIVFEIKLLTNPGKLFLEKGIAKFVSAFFPKLTYQELKDSSD